MNKVKPTEKQSKAMQLIKDGETLRQSMLKAGYSVASASHPSENLLRTEGAQSIIDRYKAEYLKVGITPGYMVKKTAEWLEATKPFSSHTEPDKMVPDYQTQQKAAEFVRKDFGLAENKEQGSTFGDVTINIINYGNKPAV